MAEQESVVIRLRKFFDIPSTTFIKEYKELTMQDREDLKKGIDDGTYNY